MAFELIPEQGMCKIEQALYPGVGFGTYPFTGETCFKAVSEAVKAGYRIIDTATFYNNFMPIGKVLKQAGRQQFYIISKVWPNAQTPERLRKDLETTLQQLQTDYLDGYLIHWPNSKIPIEETLNTMEELKKQGLIRHIGLSNVTVNHLKRVFELNIPISWVQIEMNPFFYDPALVKFCQTNGITVLAWAPLSRGRTTNDPLLLTLGKKYGKTASQVALRWILQHGCIPLPGSKNKQHMLENRDILDFALTQEEMHALDERAQTGKRERITAQAGLGFTDEFEFTYEQCWPKRVL